VNHLISNDTLSGKTKKYKGRNPTIFVAEEQSFGGRPISATPCTPGALVNVVTDDQFVVSLGTIDKKNVVAVCERIVA
jgi:hypothetical protein